MVNCSRTATRPAVEQLRANVAELQIASVRSQVQLSIFADWKDGEFTPSERATKAVDSMLDQLLVWANALKPLRQS